MEWMNGDEIIMYERIIIIIKNEFVCFAFLV